MRPHLIASCSRYGKELVKSVEIEERLRILNATQSSYSDKLRAMKNKLKDETREIYMLERTQQSIYGDKEKILQTVGDISQHETQIWDVLNTHINQTAITLSEYKGMQRRFNEERDRGAGLEEHAQQLEDKVSFGVVN